MLTRIYLQTIIYKDINSEVNTISKLREYSDEELANVTGGAQVGTYSRLDKNDVFKDNRFTNSYIVIKETVEIPLDKLSANIIHYYEGRKKSDGKVHVNDMTVIGVCHNLIMSYYTLTDLPVVFDNK